MSRDGKLLVAVTAVAAAVTVAVGIERHQPLLIALAVVALVTAVLLSDS